MDILGTTYILLMKIHSIELLPPKMSWWLDENPCSLKLEYYIQGKCSFVQLGHKHSGLSVESMVDQLEDSHTTDGFKI